MARGNPVFARQRSAPSFSARRLHSGAVRVSCQTMALHTGRPVALSHTTVVSR
ncbi:MAG: hypothetical protein BWY83_02948 [bacterium ADurb.Bin478]|nr:MAG: hypothetical protein BWY83_02948 [bacterium ADurb.Bin478]